MDGDADFLIPGSGFGFPEAVPGSLPPRVDESPSHQTEGKEKNKSKSLSAIRSAHCRGRPRPSEEISGG